MSDPHLRWLTGASHPAVVSFSDGDTLDEEAREEVPRPPLPSVNRARGRIGLDYITTTSQGMTSSNVGVAFRGDITRIGGTYCAPTTLTVARPSCAKS